MDDLLLNSATFTRGSMDGNTFKLMENLLETRKLSAMTRRSFQFVATSRATVVFPLQIYLLGAHCCRSKFSLKLVSIFGGLYHAILGISDRSCTTESRNKVVITNSRLNDLLLQNSLYSVQPFGS